MDSSKPAHRALMTAVRNVSWQVAWQMLLARWVLSSLWMTRPRKSKCGVGAFMACHLLLAAASKIGSGNVQVVMRHLIGASRDTIFHSHACRTCTV